MTAKEFYEQNIGHLLRESGYDFLNSFFKLMDEYASFKQGEYFVSESTNPPGAEELVREVSIMGEKHYIYKKLRNMQA